MKLHTHIFYVTDSKGEEINLERKKVNVILNGKKTESYLVDLFNPRHLEFDDGEVCGNSLLRYYAVQPDGSLTVEGSTIQFSMEENNEPVLVKSIERPFATADAHIAFELVKLFADTFKIAKPDEVFDNLKPEEKQIFIDERNNRSKAEQKKIDDEAAAETERLKQEAEKAAADKEKADADAAEKIEQDKQEQIRQAKEAEKKLLESIDPEFLRDKNEYASIQGYYRGIEFKEYIQSPYHLFYGKDEDVPPCVLIKRGDVWQEIEEPFVAEETDATVVIEFNDGDVAKKLTLDIAAKEIKVTDADVKE